ncbi:MAG: hypothetical protein ACRD2L_11520, partial [Terriglobia bacterium]
MKKLTQAQREDILKVAKERPEGLEDALRQADNPTTFDKAIELWKAGVLSAPSTVMIQAFDVLETGSRVGETAIASVVDKLLGGPRTRFGGEVRAEVQGFLETGGAAQKQFHADLLDVLKAAPEKIDPDRPLEFQTGKIGGKTGRIIRTPFRLLNATSKFLRTTGTSAEMYKLAFRDASRELGPGAKPEAVRARMNELVQEALDPNAELGAKLLAEAAKVGGKERVFEAEPGPLIDSLLKLRSENPWLHGVFPFLHVPGNITKLIAQRSPLGFVKAAKAFAKYKRALTDKTENVEALKGEAVDAIARPLFGTAVMATFAGAAAMGNMTGGGPVDKKARNLKLASGWQPYSFVLPGELLGEPGKKIYIPYKRIQPVGALLGFAADMVESKDLKSNSERFEKGLESAGQNLTSQTYLQGIADAMEFVSNP